MLLPLSSVAMETKPVSREAKPTAAGTVEYEFLPSAAEILGELVPVAFKTRLFKCFLDAAVSEQIARRVAMKAATENAGDLIKSVTRLYNRTRQANITKEISELIAGSEHRKRRRETASKANQPRAARGEFNRAHRLGGESDSTAAVGCR